MILFFWVLLALVCGLIGQHRKIGFWGAFFVSLILSPLIGFIVAILSPDDAPPPPPVRVDVTSVQEKLNPNASLSEQLKQLYDLKENGAITQEEYVAAKSKMLA